MKINIESDVMNLREVEKAKDPFLRSLRVSLLFDASKHFDSQEIYDDIVMLR